MVPIGKFRDDKFTNDKGQRKRKLSKFEMFVIKSRIKCQSLFNITTDMKTAFIVLIFIIVILFFFMVAGTWDVTKWMAGLDQTDEVHLPGKK